MKYLDKHTIMERYMKCSLTLTSWSPPKFPRSSTYLFRELNSYKADGIPFLHVHILLSKMFVTSQFSFHSLVLIYFLDRSSTNAFFPVSSTNLLCCPLFLAHSSCSCTTPPKLSAVLFCRHLNGMIYVTTLSSVPGII